MLQQKW